MKTELKVKVLDFLSRQGISAHESGTCVAVNRDSMCQSKFSKGGTPETDAYPAVLYAVKEFVGTEHRLFWAGKTDDDLFLDIIQGETP